MRKIIAPETFGLHRTTIIEQIDPQTYSLILRRKSRVIMTDGRKLLERAEKIKKIIPDAVVQVETTAPVCSKTMAFLADHDIVVQKTIG